MKKAFGWSITAIGVACLMFLFGMFWGRHTLKSPQNTATPYTSSTYVTEYKRLNINTATAEQLQNLPGIGETIAKRIIAYREANGPFVNTLQLNLVEGIGEGKLNDIIDLICVEDIP